jgi:hypothetical protein
MRKPKPRAPEPTPAPPPVSTRVYRRGKSFVAMDAEGQRWASSSSLAGLRESIRRMAMPLGRVAMVAPAITIIIEEEWEQMRTVVAHHPPTEADVIKVRHHLPIEEETMRSKTAEGAVIACVMMLVTYAVLLLSGCASPTAPKDASPCGADIKAAIHTYGPDYQWATDSPTLVEYDWIGGPSYGVSVLFDSSSGVCQETVGFWN